MIHIATARLPRFLVGLAPLVVALAACRSEEHTSELQSLAYLVCRLLLEKKKKQPVRPIPSLLPPSPRTSIFHFTSPRNPSMSSLPLFRCPETLFRRAHIPLLNINLTFTDRPR